MSSTTFGPLILAHELKSLQSPFVILDTRAIEEYEGGHLPGAIHADLNSQLSAAAVIGFNPVHGGRHPLPSITAWSRQLGAWGIHPNMPVIAYDDAGGASGACRLWWMLRAAGHPKAAVLDGGLRAAQGVGIDLTTEPMLDPIVFWPYPCFQWNFPIAEIVEVETCLKDAEWKVLDVRSRERWRGEVEPLDPVKGRIPGTVNLPYQENLTPEMTFKKPEILRRQYLELLDGVPSENLIVHCGSGVTACHTLLALELAGMAGASLYVGSYSEWCRSRLPIQTGP